MTLVSDKSCPCSFGFHESGLRHEGQTSAVPWNTVKADGPRVNRNARSTVASLFLVADDLQLQAIPFDVLLVEDGNRPG
jgi:hypothetical protein